MDVGADFAIPNPWGLLPADMGYDMDGYRTALAFLSDLSGGSEHDHALTNNGGSTALLTAWKGSPKFRRVYEKCRKAAAAERAAMEARKQKAAEGEAKSADTGTGQRFVRLEDMPVVRTIFTGSHRIG